jgi:uncharacterized protein with NRDE domain
MCLIALAWGASERFPLVIAANRDEFLARPTAPLAPWISPGGATIVGGRDLQDGGTWMGFSPSGRFAMLTNVRQPTAPPPVQPVSRGSLPLAWLESHLPASEWISTLNAASYQGFNLIVGDWPARQCHYISNSNINSGQNTFLSSNLKPFEQLAGIEYARAATDLIANEMHWAAIYGLSNASLDTAWPKTLQLKSAVRESLESADADELTQSNLKALTSRDQPTDAQLPTSGVPLELERALSSIFVSHPTAAPSYGTRTSLVAVFQPGLGLKLTEITHAQRGSAQQLTSTLLRWT